MRAIHIPRPAPTYETLFGMANPQNASAPELVPYAFWDSQSYTSGTTTTMTFFQNTNVDKTVANLPQSGTLPDPWYLILSELFFDVQQSVTSGAGATAVTGVYDNIQKLVLATNTRCVFTISGKPYMECPLSMLHGTGGAIGFVSSGSDSTGVKQLGINNVPDGTWGFNGAVIIPPKQSFDLTIVWSSAVTLTGNVNVRATITGALARRVL